MQYISIREIADRVLMHPLLADIPFERVILHAVDLMRILNIPPAFNDKVVDIEIDNYKGLIPSDFFTVNQVRFKRDKFVLAAATDVFHIKEEERIVYPCYKIQGKYLITSTKDLDVEMSYKAILTDCDGYPVIPDDASFIKALEAYIKERKFVELFDMGKITQQALTLAQQEYSWYAGQAQASMIMPSIDEMAAISNMWNRLIPTVEEHTNSFRTINIKERMRKW